MKDSGQRQGGSLSHVSCRSPEYVCWRGSCAGMCFLLGFGFSMSLCWTGLVLSPWKGAVPPTPTRSLAKGLRAALPLNLSPPEGAPLVCAWLKAQEAVASTLPSLPSWAPPQPGELLFLCCPRPLCCGWATPPTLPGEAHSAAASASGP